MRICCVLVFVATWAAQSVHAGIDHLYRIDKPDHYGRDVLKLHSGEMRTGKIIEWADQVLVFDSAGNSTAVPAVDVDWIQVRSDDADADRPLLPDLTVAYIERLPRTTSWHSSAARKNGLWTVDADARAMKSGPASGDPVRFRVHILNAGGRISTPVDCIASIDGVVLGERAAIPAIEPGAEFTAEFSWQWTDDAGDLVVEIDKAGGHQESVRWNNRFVEPVGGLGVVVAVPRRVHAAFQTMPNLVDSYCFEDYVQYQLRCFNALLEASRYPTSPDGVIERVRLDRIVIVDDADDAALRQSLVDDKGRSEYDALISMPELCSPNDGGGATGFDAHRVNWPALRRIGHEIGLIDSSVFDTTLKECAVYDRFGRPAIVRHVSPDRPSIMRQPGPFVLSEVEAAHLNRTHGAPRGVRGTYLYQIPEQIVLEVTGTNGVPIPGVLIEVFQLKTRDDGTRSVCGISGSDPWVATQTDPSGRAPLPNRPCAGDQTPDGYSIRPNAFGQISTDGGNGLLLIRLRHGDGANQMESFQFLSLFTCKEADLRGNTNEYVHRIATRFAHEAAASIPRIPFTFADVPERDDPHPAMNVTWPVSSGIDLTQVGEYRLYRRLGFGGEDTNPWALIDAVPQPLNARANNQSPQDYLNAHSRTLNGEQDTWFAVSIADRSGREGPMSEPTFLPYGKECHKLAIQDKVAYMTLSGDGPPYMLYWDAVAGSQAYLPRTDRFSGYAPNYEGVAFCNEGLVVTDPVNHVLAVYDVSYGRHELVKTIPHRSAWPGPPSFLDGEFNSPADVAVDARHRMYVADRGNHRVQILSSTGAFIDVLDPDFRFRGPHAIAFSNGRICVTDDNGKRVRVYDVQADSPKFVLQLPEIIDADRALTTDSGDIIVTGRRSAATAWTVLHFKPAGQSAEFADAVETFLMGTAFSPRGLYQHQATGHLAYFVNSFPFDVRGLKIGRQPGK